jgi:hypothetical protein
VSSDTQGLTRRGEINPQTCVCREQCGKKKISNKTLNAFLGSFDTDGAPGCGLQTAPLTAGVQIIVSF